MVRRAMVTGKGWWADGIRGRGRWTPRAGRLSGASPQTIRYAASLPPAWRNWQRTCLVNRGLGVQVPSSALTDEALIVLWTATNAWRGVERRPFCLQGPRLMTARLTAPLLLLQQQCGRRHGSRHGARLSHRSRLGELHQPRARVCRARGRCTFPVIGGDGRLRAWRTAT